MPRLKSYRYLGLAKFGMSEMENAFPENEGNAGAFLSQNVKCDVNYCGVFNGLGLQGNFTDVANFTLRCVVCQKGLKGQSDAVEHAKAEPDKTILHGLIYIFVISTISS